MRHFENRDVWEVEGIEAIVSAGLILEWIGPKLVMVEESTTATSAASEHGSAIP